MKAQFFSKTSTILRKAANLIQKLNKIEKELFEDQKENKAWLLT